MIPEKDITELNVFINFGTPRLGDSIAWVSVVEKFQEENPCNIFLSTYWNDLVRETYPNITFLEPKPVPLNFDTYDDGWQCISTIPQKLIDKEKQRIVHGDSYSPLSVYYYKDDFDVIYDFTEIIQWPFDRGLNIQEIAYKALGLDYDSSTEKITRITVKEEPDKNERITKPYVCVASQSLAQCKFWNYPNGWNEIVEYLKKRNYEVVCIDEKTRGGNRIPRNTISMTEHHIDDIIKVLNGAEFFIGLSSGLSWLAWALNKHVVMISGFTNPDHEFQTKCERVFNPNVCNDCFGKYPLDPTNWNWCPEHENTDRMFECSKQITPEMVKEAIDNTIRKL